MSAEAGNEKTETRRCNEARLASLYEEYYDKIAHYIYVRIGTKTEAEDLAGEVFLKALESLKSYKERGIPMQAWLFRIAHNLVVDHLRKAAKSKTVPIDTVQIESDARVGLESTIPMGIANRTPGKTIVTDIIEDVRIIKTDYEIGRIFHACKIVNKGHKVVFKKCRPKVLEFALYKEITDAMTSKIVQDIPNANFRATETTGAIWL